MFDELNMFPTAQQTFENNKQELIDPRKTKCSKKQRLNLEVKSKRIFL